MISYGAVHHIEGVPNLDNDGEKDRYLIVLDPRLLNGVRCSTYVCVGASCSTRRPSRILLPNRDDNPGSSRAMPRRSWAVPEWIVLTPACLLLGPPQTTLAEIDLKAVADAVLKSKARVIQRMECLPRPNGCEYCKPLSPIR